MSKSTLHISNQVFYSLVCKVYGVSAIYEAVIMREFLVYWESFFSLQVSVFKSIFGKLSYFVRPQKCKMCKMKMSA